MTLVEFKLNPEEAAMLQKPINGQGGYQSFGRRIQGKLQPDGIIQLSDEEIGRIVRMASYAKGDGGFEGRLQQAFRAHVVACFSRTPGQGGILL